MELVSAFSLTVVLLIIISIVIIYRRIYITKDGKTRKKDLYIQIMWLCVMALFFIVLPFNSEITDVNKNSTVITEQETITRYFVVDGTDTLLVSKNSETDILSTGILPDSVKLKTETKYTLYGWVTRKSILK